MKAKTTNITLLAIIAIIFTAFSAGRSATAQDTAAPTEPAMKLLGRLVGGVWRTTGNFKAELTYEWRIPGKAIRGLGKAAIGTPQEFPMESLYGWDAKEKKVYYMDFHGHDTVYQGLATATGNTFNGDFAGLIGDTGHYRFSDELSDDNTLEASMFAADKDGKWVKIHSMTFKRQQ